MQLDIKGEIIESYQKLIHNCKVAIENGEDVEKNLQLIDEYNKVLNYVKAKPNNSYDSIIKEMQRVATFKSEIKFSISEKGIMV